MQTPDIVNDLARLKWACRRGMLELDVLLNNFLARGYSDLPLSEKYQFIALLEQSDPVLFAWLMGHETPEADFVTIVEKIRRYGKS